MKLTFFGAAKSVTGSCHCVECADKKILLDCGLQQGKDERDNRQLDFDPTSIDVVVLSHSHIDHSGRLPLLVKQGFSGNIYCSRLTAELLDIMLRDSAHIQESDTQWKNQKGQRAGKPPEEPLYTLNDVEDTLKRLVPIEYGEEVEITDGVRLTFSDAGHLLGSGCVELWLTEGNTEQKLVYTGDLGNKDQPIIRDPQPVLTADYLITESTYGDRLHDTSEKPDYTADLAEVIDRTLGRGGNVIIPSFAVGRTQELLYFIRKIKEQGLAKSVPDFQVYVDSPLAEEATRIYSGNLDGYLDEEAIEELHHGNLFVFPGLEMSKTVEESKSLNEDPTPKVIISASGMCDAGRIRHHLKHNLWRRECTVLFVGYQGEGSLGRCLLDGASSVRLFGEDIAVKAELVNFHGLSSHADQAALLAWTETFDPKPKQIFVVHGDSKVTEIYADLLQDHGFNAHSVNFEEVYDLITDTVLSPGIVLEPKKKSAAQEATGSPAYKRLVQIAQRLQQIIQDSKGRANKDLAKLADQLCTVLDKWEK